MADIFFSLLTSLTNHKIVHNKYTLEDLKCQCYLNNSTITRLNLNGGIEHLDTVSSCSSIFRKTILKLPLSIKDKENYWKNDIDAQEYIENKFNTLLLHSNIGRHQQDSFRLSKLSSQSFLEHLIKFGFASHLVKPRNKTDKTYQIDLLHLYTYDVRPKLHRYGCLIILDQNLSIISIKVPHLTNDLLIKNADKLLMKHPNFGKYSHMKEYYDDLIWKQTCNIAISSIFLHVTLKNKILDTHFHLLGSILTSYYRHYNYLPDEIKELFGQFIFRGNLVNSDIKKIMISKRGILVRLFGLKKKHFKRYLKNQSSKMETPSPHLIDPIIPIKTDLIKYWDTFNDFSHRLSNYLNTTGVLSSVTVSLFVQDIIYKTNIGNSKDPTWKNLAAIICHLIYTVSVWNSNVCTIAPYLLHPKLVQTKIFKKCPQSEFGTKSGFTQNVYLALFTTMDSNPKMTENHWENQSQDPYIQGIWKKLQQDLMKLDITEKNLNPNLLECSLTL
jgi:hypothetical protein